MATILLVDDSDIVLTCVTRMLTRGGHAVITACDGEKALNALSRSDNIVDLIISDFCMPMMDGVTLFQRIAVDFPRMAGKFMFHTSECEQLALLEGLQGVPRLDKPSRQGEFMKVVSGILAANEEIYG